MWGFFPKNVFHEWTNFFWQKIYGKVALNGRTNDQIMPTCRRGFINDKCIFQHLNTVNLHLKIKPWPFYKIIKGFILKVNSWEILVVVSCSVFLMLTLTWDIDILFEKLTAETGGWIRNTPFALCLWVEVGISYKACGLGASE